MTPPTTDNLEFEPLGAAREVDPVRTRGQGLRLGASLVLVGLAIGAIVAVGATVAGGFLQTEAGLCRITWAQGVDERGRTVILFDTHPRG